MPKDRTSEILIGIVAVVVAVVAGSAVWWVSRSRIEPDLNRADLAAFLLALVVALVAFAGWAIRRTRVAGVREVVDSADRAAGLIRGYATARWQREAEQRQLTLSTPVMIRWSWATDENLAVPIDGLRRALPEAARGQLLDEGTLAEIRDGVYRPVAAAGGRVVLIGAAGSGKTSAMILLARALLESEPDGPIPIWLPLSSWNPLQETLHGWVAARVHADHPALSVIWVRQLVADRRIALFLDGLDEMPPDLQGQAIEAIGKEAARLPTLISSRPEEFEAALESARLRTAAVIELMPPDPVDVAAFLLEDERGDQRRRWRAVLEQLREDPDSPAAETLRTPLMLTLAKAGYHRSDPTEMLDRDRFPAAPALRAGLFSRFMDLAYDDSRDRDRALHWLSWMARGMGSSRDLRWWNIPQAVPVLPRAVLCGLIAAPLPILLAAGLAWFAFGPVVGTVVGLAAFPLLALWVGYTGVQADTALITDSGPITLRFRGPRWRVMPARYRVWTLLALIGVAVVMATATEVIYRLRGQPVSWYWPLIAGVSISLVNLGWTRLLEWGKWEIPLSRLPAATPLLTYRNDLARFRVTVLLSALIAIPFGAGAAAGTGYLVYRLLAATSVVGSGAQHNLVYGFAVFGATVAWTFPTTRGGVGPAIQLKVTSFVVLLRTWGGDRTGFLALLEEARGRGVLRQSGANYQFRHAELQDYLARQPTGTALPDEPFEPVPTVESAAAPGPAGDDHRMLQALLGLARTRDADGGTYRRLGDEYLRLGQYPEARHAYRIAVDRGEATAGVYSGLGDADRLSGLPGVYAEESYDLALEIDASDRRALLGKAAVLLGREDFAEATGRYRECLRAEPGDVDALIGVGRAEAGRRHWAEAREAIAAAARADSQRPEVWTAIGDFHRSRIHGGLWSFLRDASARRAAQAAYDRALRLEPDDEQALRSLAEMYQASGRFGAAAAVYRRLLRVTADPAIYRRLGDGYLREGDFERAETAYRFAVAEDPQSVDNCYELGSILVRRRKFERGYEMLRRAEALIRDSYPGDLYPMFQRSMVNDRIVAVRRSMIAEQQSIANYYELAQITPQLFAWQVEIGDRWRGAELWDFAAEAYRVAIGMDERNATAHLRLGEVLLEQDRPEKALAAFRRAAELDRRTTAVLVGLGVALIRLRRFSDAERELRSAYDLRPDDEVLGHLATALRGQGRHQDADVLERRGGR